MKISFQTRLTAKAWGLCLCSAAFAALALLLAATGGCGDRILADSEQAIVGSYALDHVRGSGTGGTPPGLELRNCTLTIRPDHSFAFTNVPSADLSQTVSYTGTWSLRIMRVWETTGYYLTLAHGGFNSLPLQAKFLNPVLSRPLYLEASFDGGKGKSVTFYFVKANGPE